MKKKLSLLVALTMMLGSMAGLAEEAQQGPTEAELLAQPCEFALIEANGEQPRLTYIEGVTPILEVDGYKFKDMNKNGKLDPYEDWRLDTETRVNDLISQMNPPKKKRVRCSRQRESRNGALPDSGFQPDLYAVQPERHAGQRRQHAEQPAGCGGKGTSGRPDDFHL